MQSQVETAIPEDWKGEGLSHLGFCLLPVILPALGRLQCQPGEPGSTDDVFFLWNFTKTINLLLGGKLESYLFESVEFDVVGRSCAIESAADCVERRLGDDLSRTWNCP